MAAKHPAVLLMDLQPPRAEVRAGLVPGGIRRATDGPSHYLDGALIGGELAFYATPTGETSAVHRPSERRRTRFQIVGARGVESAVMKPPHHPGPVEPD